MRGRMGLVLVTLSVLISSIVRPIPMEAASCEYVLGFATLDAMIPTVVGSCLEDQHYATNGDAQQMTSGGLLVWRKADNWTAFTDGYHTWLNGPNGLQERLNTLRFSWEADAASYPPATGAFPPPGPPSILPTATPAPAVASSGVTFTSVQGGRPGQYASVSVTTSPGASCSIIYVTPYGTVSQAQGLFAQNADSHGNVSWSWKIGTTTYAGTGTVTVTCNGHASTADIDIG